ncbi:MAG: ribonuclease HI, partial [Bacteroidetes bacterium]|nr:ribonuclease HI [Bacteroidota bacterium]
MSLPKVTIYTDGSCKPNPGPGGWGAVIIFNDKSCQEKGGELETTNNRMELTAPLKALQSLPIPHEVTLITDSMYLKNGITVWIHKWKLCGWKTVDNQSAKNRDLWEALDEEISRHKVIWKWVKGHTNNRFNELADQLASSARKRVPLPLDSDGKIHIFLGVTWKHTIDKGAWAAILSYGNHIKIIGGAE